MARSLGPGRAALAMGGGPAGSGTPGLPLPPRRMEDPPQIPDPPPPCRLAGPRGRRSALRRAWAWAWAGRRRRSGRRRAGGLPAGGGGRRRQRWARARGLPGAGPSGLRLTPWSPAPSGGHAPQVRTPYRGGDARARGPGRRAPGNELRAEPSDCRQRRAGGASARAQCLRGPGGPCSAPTLGSPSAGGRARETARSPGSMGRRGSALHPPGQPAPPAASRPPGSPARPRVPAPPPPTSGLPGTSSLRGLRGCPRAAASPRPAHPPRGANSSSLHPRSSNKVQIPQPPPGDTRLDLRTIPSQRPLFSKKQPPLAGKPRLPRDPTPRPNPAPPGARPLGDPRRPHRDPLPCKGASPQHRTADVSAHRRFPGAPLLRALLPRSETPPLRVTPPALGLLPSAWPSPPRCDPSAGSALRLGGARSAPSGRRRRCSRRLDRRGALPLRVRAPFRDAGHAPSPTLPVRFWLLRRNSQSSPGSVDVTAYRRRLPDERRWAWVIAP